MKFHVVLHPSAEADIERNANWWKEHHSAKQALDWLDIVQEQLNTLANFPARCSVAPESALFPYEIRQLPVGLGSRKSYRAVFAIKNHEVHVLAVRRGAQEPLRSGSLPDELEQ